MATRSSMSIMADNGELTVDELAEFVSRLFTTVSGPETVTLRAMVKMGGRIKSLTAEFNG